MDLTVLEDSFIADLVVGLGTGQIKTGAPCRYEIYCTQLSFPVIKITLAGKVYYKKSTLASKVYYTKPPLLGTCV